MTNAPTLGVHSEIGTLRQAIVHRPGLELSRLTPDNIEALLFDDILWAERARDEHDAFVEALRGQGVIVHHFADLLAETLELPTAREEVLNHLCTPEMVGAALVEPLRKLADDVDGKTLAEYLVGGITKSDLHPQERAQLALGFVATRRPDSGAASEPPVSTRQFLLDLRRRQHQHDGQARPST